MSGQAQPYHGAVSATPASGRQRLTGVDAARGLALAGMMSVHVVPLGEPDASLAYLVAAGRSAALFAVLAGVGIALATGGARADPRPDHERPGHRQLGHRQRGHRLGPARRALAARSAVVAAIGLTLAGFGTPVLVILPYYGLLFLLALPVLGWGARRLAVLAASAAVVTPVLHRLLRDDVPASVPGNLTWADVLAAPADVATDLLLTGTYPVLTWSTYLFAGLAVGRLPLTRTCVARGVLLAGAGLAVLGWALGQGTLTVVGRGRLGAAMPGGVAEADVDRSMLHAFFGTPPTDDWWWLGVQAPHLGSVADLVHTTGTSLLVLGVCVLLVPLLRGWVRPLVAAGSMTLTLYSGHVLVVGRTWDAAWQDHVPAGLVWATHVAVALLVATLWDSPRRRGPLAALAAAAARRAAFGPPAASSGAVPPAGSEPP